MKIAAFVLLIMGAISLGIAFTDWKSGCAVPHYGPVSEDAYYVTKERHPEQFHRSIKFEIGLGILFITIGTSLWLKAHKDEYD